MFTKLMAVLIAAVLVFGSAAATASAAQSSLPLDSLYPLKTLRESVELGLTVSAADKLEKALEHTQRRVDEMMALSQIGTDVPEHLAVGYAEQVEYTLRLASKMSDSEMAQALEKIQISLQEQQGAVAGLLATRPEDMQLAILAKQLGQYVDLVGLGQSQPGMFREQLAALSQGFEEPSSTQDPSVTEAPSATETPEPGDDNSNDANANDSNTNDGSANSNGSDDGNANDDSSNSNGSDDGNANDDSSNSNGSDDGNANNDHGNSNGSDDGNANDDSSNSNGSDDANANDDQGNSNGSDAGNANDDSGNTNDDNGNSNDNGSNANNNDDGNANDNNGNGSDASPSSGVFLNGFFTFVTWIKGAVFA
jgi:hypothetical protein